MLVKVITKEQGVEAHRISRVTTVTWRDADGNERGVQYVSLQGWHATPFLVCCSGSA